MTLKMRRAVLFPIIIVGVTIAILIVISKYKFMEKSKRELAETSKALLEFQNDNTLALKSANLAYEIGLPSPNPITSRTLAAIGYSFNERPRYLVKLIHKASVNRVAFSPDGKHLASASDDGTACLLRIKDNRKTILNHDGKVSSAEFSPTGDCLLTISWDKSGKIWDFDGNEIAVLHHNSPVTFGIFVNGGAHILTGARNGILKLWNNTGKLEREIRTQQQGISAISFSSEYQLILIASWSRTIKLFDLNGRHLDTVECRAAVSSARFSPSGRKVVAACWDNHAYIFDVQKKADGFTLTQSSAELDHKDVVTDAIFAPDGQTVLTASRSGFLQKWDLKEHLLKNFVHGDKITSISFSTDGRTALSTSLDGTAKLWDYNLGIPLAELKKFKGKVNHAVLSENSNFMLTADSSHSAVLWDIRPRFLLELKHQENTQVTSAVFSPDGRNILTTSTDNSVKIWNLQGRLIADLKEHSGAVYSGIYSPDGNWIATFSADKTVKIWGKSGTLITDDMKPLGVASAVAISPDSKTILTSNLDGYIFLWSNEGKLKGMLKDKEKVKQRQAIKSIAYSDDGSRIMSVSGYNIDIWSSEGQKLMTLEHDGEIKTAVLKPGSLTVLTATVDDVLLWDKNGDQKYKFKITGIIRSATFSNKGDHILIAAENKAVLLRVKDGKLIKEFYHNGPVLSAVFAPTEDLLLTASADHTAKLWTFNGELLADFNLHKGEVFNASFSPHGKRVVTVSKGEATARVWTLPSRIHEELKEKQTDLAAVPGNMYNTEKNDKK